MNTTNKELSIVETSTSHITGGGGYIKSACSKGFSAYYYFKHMIKKPSLPVRGQKIVLRNETQIFGRGLNESCRVDFSQPKNSGRLKSTLLLTAKNLDVSDINADINRRKEKVKMKTQDKLPEAGHYGSKRAAFTLAEVLITLGIIGVVAALTIPTLMKNIQDRVLTAQVRTAKYKLTLATDKMKSLGLIEAYPTTADFITELSKHFKIAKVCDNSHLRECWTSDTITVPNTSGTFTEVSVSTLKNGTKIKALGLGTSATTTMGMITGDGVSMILTYSPVCQALDFATTYSWSTEDGKPVTNATTNCISAIFDVNGATGPNRIGKDVRTLNSLFGSVQFSATSVDLDGCKALKSQGLVKDCYYSRDYYAGAVKKCNDIGLHLPDPQTLAVIAGARYGRTDIGTYTLIMSDAYAKMQSCGGRKCTSCTDYYNTHRNYSKIVTRSDKIVCTPSSIPNGTNSSIANFSGYFFSSSESSKSTAFLRNIHSDDSSWLEADRNYGYPLCVGD